MKNRADSPNTHDLSIRKRTVERADEVSYLLIQVKKPSPVGLEAPITLYSYTQDHKYRRIRERERERERESERDKMEKK